MNCILTTTDEYINLKNKFDIDERTLKSAISVWQEDNGLDKFPTEGDIKSLLSTTDYLQSDLKAIPLDGNEMLYKNYNLLTNDGKIKQVTDNVITRKWVETLNLSPNYQFKIRNTTDGSKILIFPKITLFQNSNNSNNPNKDLENKMTNFLNKIGVTIDVIPEGDFVAKARIIDKIVQVVHGKADVTTLPEETAHFFTMLLKKNGTLYTQMFGQINGYQVYRDVYDEYKDIYILADGTPDIDKIKNEAIGKLISRHIVELFNNKNTTTQSSNWFTRAWNVIIAVINKGLNSVGISGFSQLIDRVDGKDVYVQSAERILSGNINGLSFSNLEDNESNYDMLQNTIVTQQQLVNGILKAQPRFETFNEKRGIETIHGYTIDKGLPTEKRITVTPSTISKTDERRKNRNKPHVDSETESKYGKMMKEGTKIHGFLEDFTRNKFSKTPVGATSLYQSLSKEDKFIYDKAATNANAIIEEIIRDNPGSIFLPEVTLYDPSFDYVDEYGKKHKGVAGSIDLLVVHSDGTVSIYDWKTVNKKSAELNIYKYGQYSMQVAIYKRMLLNGNLNMGIPKVRGIKKTRLLPIEMVRDKLNNLKDFKFTSQVPVSGENTNNEKLNLKVEAMYDRYNRMLKDKAPSDPAERQLYQERLENLRDILIALQLKKSYSTILDQADNDLHGVLMTISKESVSSDDLQTALEYTAMYKDIMDYADESGITPEIRARLKDLMATAKEYEGIIQNKISTIQQSRAKEYGIDDLLKTQNGVGWIAKTFRSISQVNHPIISYLHGMVKGSLIKTEQESNEFRDELVSQISLLEKYAKSKGITLQQAYDKIVNKKYGGLISVFSDDYKKAKRKAFEDGDTEWIKNNLEVNKELVDKIVKSYSEYVRNEVYSKNEIKNKQIQEQKIVEFSTLRYNLMTSPFVRVKSDVADKWYSSEWAELNRPENKELLDFYNFYTENTKKFSQMLPNFGYTSTFIPNIKKTFIEELSNLKSGKNLISSIQDLISVDNTAKQGLGAIDQDSGTQGGQIPLYFVNQVEVNKKSFDLGKVLQMFAEMAYNYTNMSEIETSAVSALGLLKNQAAYEVSKFTGKRQVNQLTQNPKKSIDANKGWVEMYSDFMEYFIYGVKTQNANKFTEIMSALNNYTAFNMLGLSVFPALAAATANVMNTSIQAARNEYFTSKQLLRSTWLMSGGSATSQDERMVTYGFLQLFQPHIDNRKFAKDRDLSSKSLPKIASMDHFFIGMRAPDMFNQSIICLSILQNSTFDKDGNIVLIKEVFKKPIGYYDLSKEERAKVDAEISEKIKSTKSVFDMGKMVDEKFVIEGHEDLTKLTDKVVNNFRQFTRQINKNIIGNVDPDDISTYRLNAYARSLMLFRNWLPRSFDERYGELRYNRELGRHEQGRYRTLFTHLQVQNFWSTILGKNKDEANKMRWNLLHGIENSAKLEWVKETTLNPELADEMTMEEYIDLYKSNMKASYRGLAITSAMLLLIFFSGKYFNDDDNLTPGEKYLAKIIKRSYTEMAMFANPLEAINILKSPSAATQPLVTFVRAMEHSIKQITGEIINDDDLMKRAHPLKYWMNFNPLVGLEKSYRLLDEHWQEQIEDNRAGE